MVMGIVTESKGVAVARDKRSVESYSIDNKRPPSGGLDQFHRANMEKDVTGPEKQCLEYRV